VSGWIYSGQSTRKGSSHETNDDALYASEPGPISKDGFVAVICDGVSSVPDGRWSAQQTCTDIEHFFQISKKRTPAEYKKKIQEISTSIYQTERKRGACTLSLCWIIDEKLHSFAVGDTQVALWREDQLCVLTEDRDQGGRVRFFIGMRDSLSPGLQSKQISLQDNDLLLIMSDGVSEIVSQQDFSHIWQHCYEDPQLCADKLVQFAHFSGSTDDNSVIVLHYRSGE
jgi:serine/threonine protein phosphatase PrpC